MFESRKKWKRLLLSPPVMSLSGLINLFMPMSIAVYPDCDYYQDLFLGQQYYIYNPQYPKMYKSQTACRWIARSPASTRIIITCEDIDIPVSVNCQDDRLAISLSGDADFKDARTYCGKGTKSLVSKANKLAVGLFASTTTSGGRFLCTVTAISTTVVTTSPPPLSCDCGWQQRPRIVNGTNAGVNEFPSMAGIVHLIARDIECGGTIISNRYIITAAHCFMTDHEAQNYAALVGDHDISRGDDTEYSKLYQLENIKSHPNYNQTSYENDIAVVRTRNDMAFNFAVGPACLPFRYSFREFVGVRVTALGWGQEFYAGPKSDILQKVNLTVISNTQCQRENTDTIYNSQICTYTPYKDACSGDSGGPLLWHDYATQRLFLIGVISHGTFCATDVPAVNSRVTSYLAWIISETTDADYCVK